MTTNTPDIQEFALGDRNLALGERALSFGRPPRVDGVMPELLIARAAREAGLIPYAVYIPIGVKITRGSPAAIYKSLSITENPTLQRRHAGIVTQTFEIIIRSHIYENTIKHTNQFLATIRHMAGPRYQGMEGWSDNYDPIFQTRSVTTAVTLRK